MTIKIHHLFMHTENKYLPANGVYLSNTQKALC